MTDYTKLFERAGAHYEAPRLSTEGLLRRRDRKRRNQRIAAGTVGIAVFLAAVMIVIDAEWVHRSKTPAVTPTAHRTETPAATPTDTRPTDGPLSVGFEGLVPAGLAPSEPLRGQLVMRDVGIHPWYAVYVYADGRLIWSNRPRGDSGPTTNWIEQRLTPEGVELLRSGAVPLGGQFENPGVELPASAWEDPELRPYAPSRYAVLPWSTWGGDPYRDLELLPPQAQDLLRGTEQQVLDGHESIESFVVTVEDARLLATILIAAGYEQGGTWFSESGQFTDGKFDVIEFVTLLPDGTITPGGGG